MVKGKKLCGSHVLIVGAGSTVKGYKEKIEKFIKENNAVTIGINNMSGMIIPDYHFWGSKHRWRRYGKKASDKSYFIFPPDFSKASILKFGNKSYSILEDRYWKVFRNTLIRTIFFSYTKLASKISIVGMDGYSFYSYEELKTKKHAQHCYGKGLTDGQPYEHSRKKDIKNYTKLKSLYKTMKKRYKFGFEILTPTVYGEFYNSKVLDILEKSRLIPDFDCKTLSKMSKKEFMKKSKYW